MHLVLDAARADSPPEPEVGEVSMPDKYSNFDELSQNETSGVDYRIRLRRATAAFAIVAPHGGGIEPGTSEIAVAIAGEESSFYAFEGIKQSGNADLHITSTHFDEPMCLTLSGVSNIAITIHGENSDEGAIVFLGGLDENLGGSIGAALQAAGFDVRQHPNPDLQGRDPANICNRGTSGKGVQLELSHALRSEMFSSLSREGRKYTTPRFHAFVDAVRSVLDDDANRTTLGCS
jgi:phage replication-related protein YjqB (UPF0714/DUF867 family)